MQRKKKVETYDPNFFESAFPKQSATAAPPMNHIVTGNYVNFQTNHSYGAATAPPPDFSQSSSSGGANGKLFIFNKSIIFVLRHAHVLCQ